MIKNKTFGLLFYLRKERKNEKGECPIFLRITVDGQRATVSTNRFISETKWNSEAGKAKGNKEEIRELNTYLDTIKGSVLTHQRDMLDRGKLITAESLRNTLLGLNNARRTLQEVFEYHNERMKQKVGIEFSKSTMVRYETTLQHIKSFLKDVYKTDDIYLTEVEFRFITDLEHYFKTVKKCNHNSTLKYIRNFRKIINIAVANDWLQKDPFLNYKSKLEESKRTFLTAYELKSIETKAITIERIDLVRDLFLFACYTGLAYVDVAKLTYQNLQIGIDGKKWIYTERTKTESKSNVPLFPPALAILEKYRNHPQCIHEGTILPVKSNQKVNLYLKELADICGIKKDLTFHMARHTFATTVTLTNGVPIESVSTMLGHKSIRTTQIYAKVVEKKVSEDMAALSEKLFPENKPEEPKDTTARLQIV